MTEHFESKFKGLIGGVNKLRAQLVSKRFKYKYCTGISVCQEVLEPLKDTNRSHPV